MVLESNIVEDDIEILEKYIPDIRDLAQSKEPADILDMIDDLIVDDIVEHDDEPSDAGRQLQLIYDRMVQIQIKYDVI